MKKRLFSLLMALVLVVCLLPMSAFAADDAVEPDTLVDTTEDATFVSPPEFSPNGGPFVGKVQVAITCRTPDAAIYYSVDGGKETLYAKPITITKDSVVTAVAKRANFTSLKSTVSFTKVSNYYEACTEYPSYCDLEVTQDGVYIKSFPCNETTYSGSQNLQQVSKGAKFTSIAMFTNSVGENWYKVKTAAGQNGYIYCGYVNLMKLRYDDIQIQYAGYPTSIRQGTTYSIGGKIVSEGNTLCTLNAYIKSGTIINAESVASPFTKSYVLTKSALDNGLSFSTLLPGVYTYSLDVTVLNHYHDVNDLKNVKFDTKTVTILEKEFSVYAPGCTHTYTSVVTQPTCTTGGYTKYTCTKCFYSYIGDETPAGAHFGGAASCTSKAKCASCGAEYGQMLNHSFTVYQKDGTNEWYKCATCDNTTQKLPLNGAAGDMYRMYNPNTGEHFYTGSTKERNDLVLAGWKYEGVGFKVPTSGGVPMYRLFNPNNGDHHYTGSDQEKSTLLAAGWKDEGIGWLSVAPDYPGAVAQYRLFNPNAKAGSHHYTASLQEKNSLLAAGWKDEGIGFYTLP